MEPTAVPTRSMWLAIIPLVAPRGECRGAGDAERLTMTRNKRQFWKAQRLNCRAGLAPPQRPEVGPEMGAVPAEARWRPAWRLAMPTYPSPIGIGRFVEMVAGSYWIYRQHRRRDRPSIPDQSHKNLGNVRADPTKQAGGGCDDRAVVGIVKWFTPNVGLVRVA